MAVGNHTTQGTRRVRFTANVSYRGADDESVIDYGPDYEQAEVELPANEAFRFVQEGRAVYVDPGPVTAVNEKTKAPVEPGKPKGGRK